MRTCPTAGLVFGLVALSRPDEAIGFTARPVTTSKSVSSSGPEISPVPRIFSHQAATRNPTRLYGIFDALKDAFSNDEALSPDKGEGQLEGPGMGSDFRSDADLTDVQKKWLASQQATTKKGGADPSAMTAAAMDAGGGNVKGAPLTIEKLIGTKWSLSLYLSGIPQRDPSSNLYGASTNISTRNRDPRNAGLPLGATLPEDPSARVQVELLEDGTAKVEETDFTTGTDGQWVLSPNGRTVRISLDCTGFVRTIKTKGTIQKVYWSDGENEVTSKTSTEYSISPGLVYAEIGVGYGRPGELLMVGGDGSADLGVLTVERQMGLLGASNKMEICGKLSGKMMLEDGEQ